MDQMMQQLLELSRQNAALVEEVRELRRENTRLRQELDAATGRRVHAPYAAGSVDSLGSSAVAGASHPVDPPVDVTPCSPRGLPAAGQSDVFMEHNSPEPLRVSKRAKPSGEQPEVDDA